MSLPQLQSPSRESSQSRPKLGDMLVDSRLIDEEQLSHALHHQQVHGGRIGSILVTLGYLEESRLTSTLGRQLGVDMADVESFDPPPEVLARIPEKLIRRYEVIPLAQRGRNLVIGATDPRNVTAMDDIRFAAGAARLEIRMITEATFQRFLETRFASKVLLKEIAEDRSLDGILEPRAPRTGSEESEQAPVVRLVSYLLTQAVESRASDIHIEPFETYIRIRFRIDGRLYTVLTVPQRMHRAIISRIKVLADMDISLQRRPQDGHITLDRGDDTLHFRISTLPTVFGEKCVLRLLKREHQLTDIARLGFCLEQLEWVREASRATHGLILVTGPTGSGKTTTLHAILNDINEAGTNIITLEDPVESTIPGVNHVQISDRGVDFPGALRAILRQDPDVMMIGEVRDVEVGRIALRAALTGHLVLSTLHTNGVIETVTRLVDMGLEPYLLAGSLNMIIAQRLVRRVCPSCSCVEPVWSELIDEFGLTDEQVQSAVYRRPVGCEQCFQTGYRGRVAIYETLVPSEPVRRILRRGGDEQDLINAARQEGMVWMRQAAIARALAGETSFDEVRRVPLSP